MITQTEIENLVALNGHCGYNETTKAHFRKLSMKLLRELNTRLDTKGTVSFNAGGIAVSGDASLHSDSLHLFFNADGCGLGICGRTCKGKSDYQGGPNRWYSFERLKRDGMNGLFEWARGVQAEGIEQDRSPKIPVLASLRQPVVGTRHCDSLRESQ